MYLKCLIRAGKKFMICATSNFLEKNLTVPRVRWGWTVPAVPLRHRSPGATIRPRRAPTTGCARQVAAATADSRQRKPAPSQMSRSWRRPFDVVAKRILERLEHACGGGQQVALLLNKPGGRCVRPKIWQALVRPKIWQALVRPKIWQALGGIVLCRRAVIDR